MGDKEIIYRYWMKDGLSKAFLYVVPALSGPSYNFSIHASQGSDSEYSYGG